MSGDPDPPRQEPRSESSPGCLAAGVFFNGGGMPPRVSYKLNTGTTSPTFVPRQFSRAGFT